VRTLGQEGARGADGSLGDGFVIAAGVGVFAAGGLVDARIIPGIDFERSISGRQASSHSAEAK